MAHLYKRPRSPYWQARIVVGQEAHRISTGCTDRREAQKAAARAEDELNEKLITAADLRLQDASSRFFSERLDLRPKTVQNYQSSLNNLKAVLGDFPLRILSRDQLKHYCEVRLTQCGSVAVRRDLAFLSSVYKKALGWTNGPEKNPVRDFDKSHLKNANKRTRWLTPVEFDRLTAACVRPEQVYILKMLVNTGLRINELLNLEWENVDFQQRQLIIFGDKTKNGDYRIVPLTEAAYDTLRSTHVECATGFILTNPKTGEPYTKFQKSWAGICKRGGVTNCTIHTLRHTFASWALQRGVPEIVLQHWLGHKTRSMTGRYAHPSNSSLQDAAAIFSRSTLRDTLDRNVK